MRGLAGIKKIYPVYFETRLGIHTFGMKQSIDVMVLDSKNRIVIIRKNLGPNKIFVWNPKYAKVVELPAKKYKFTQGQEVALS